LESTSFGGGRINKTSNRYEVNHYFTDHLGSTRVIYNGSSTIPRSDYTAFGTRWTTGSAATSRYQFAGKENQTTGDLPYQDFGARFFGGRLPIWITPDPLTEKYYSWSPYNYTLNNPVKFVDKDGRFPIETIWDAANVAMGARSFVANFKAGNVGAAIVDGFGVAIDVAATAIPFIPGGAGTLIKGVRAANNIVDGVNATDSAVDAGNAVNKAGDALDNAGCAAGAVKKIEISPANKVDRGLLNPSANPKNAPTFKSDGSPVEIHHEAQSPDGPFKEMHWQDHRGKGNYKTNHPNAGEPSSINRKEAQRQRQEYWRYEHENWPK
jgi:RHS repeat-associated protein